MIKKFKTRNAALLQLLVIKTKLLSMLETLQGILHLKNLTPIESKINDDFFCFALTFLVLRLFLLHQQLLLNVAGF